MALSLKPCSACLRKRQKVKDALRALSFRSKAPLTLVQCGRGDVTVDNRTRKITACEGEIDPEGLIGLEVYLAGRWVYDLEKAEALTRLGRIVKVTDIE